MVTLRGLKADTAHLKGQGTGKEANGILPLKVLTRLSIRSTVDVISRQRLKKSMRETEDLQGQGVVSQSRESWRAARWEEYTRQKSTDTSLVKKHVKKA